jgi:hypothetical protein
MSWFDYLDALNEANSYRNRIKTLDSDMGMYLDTGPQKKGSPYKTKRARFKKRKFNDVSAPPGAPGGLEEEVEEDSFEVQQELQPEFWRDNELDPEINKRLVEIVTDFIDNLPIDITVEDIRFTGSLANYNWSEYSDIDLHIVVDFSKISDDEELVKSFFDAHRLRWNDKHDIRIHNFEVEIYVENTGEEHRSSGIYSLLENKWIIEPSQVAVEIDYETAKKKSDDYMSQMRIVVNMIHSDKDYERALRNIERIKTKIRTMRQAGLASKAQEYSAENIAFKILRRENILRKLNDLKYLAYDSSMSIKEASDGV